MNKKIQQFFSQYGFQFSGNDGYGIIDGFETNLHYAAMTTTYPVQLHFSCFLSEQQATAIVNQLQAEKHKYLAASATPYGFSLGLNDLTVGKLVAKLPEILQSVCNLLKEHGALGIGYCPVCGSVLDFESGKKCKVDGSVITIDGDCVDKINAAITQANAEFNQAPNNYSADSSVLLSAGLRALSSRSSSTYSTSFRHFPRSWHFSSALSSGRNSAGSAIR